MVPCLLFLENVILIHYAGTEVVINNYFNSELLVFFIFSSDHTISWLLMLLLRHQLVSTCTLMVTHQHHILLP